MDPHVNPLLPGSPKFDIVPQVADAAPGRPLFPGPAERNPAAPPSSGLLAYWRIIQRHKGILVLVSFLGGLAALIFTLPRTPVYQARASIEIQSLNENFLNMRDVNPTTESGNSYYPEYDVQTQIRVLQSRSLIDRVMKKLDLDRRPLVLEQGRIPAWRRALGLRESGETARSAGAGNLRVRSQPNTRLIDISADSTDPRLAAEFVNTLAREFIDQNLESRWKTTQNTGEWLSRQMEDFKIKLEKSEEQLQEYARATGLVFTSEKNNVAEDRLRQLQEELSKAQGERVARQSKYEMASSASPESLPDVLDDGSLKESQSKLTDLRRQFADLTSAFTSAHPKVKRVEAQIAALETSLKKERENIVRRIRNDYEAALRRETLLVNEAAAHALRMSGQADQVAHYNILKREVDTNRQIYDSMLQRVKEAGIASALRASNIRIIDPALPPAAPYKPDLFHNTVMGLLGGAFCGLAFIVLRDRADRSIQEPGDAAFYLGVPELGLIPSAAADPVRKRVLFPFRVARGEAQPDTDGLELVTWRRKPSAMAESFRAAITSILFTPPGRERPQVIVLSSPSPKEGKTTVATNLAIALAEISTRVLLIDADLRKPRLHLIFDLENDTGLADILRRHHPVQAPLNGLLRATGIPGLAVLTSGRSALAETALLYSSRFEELLGVARNDYDIILIDTPPMLTMPDARVLARLSDGVILIARANQTSRDSIQAACRRFLEDGTRVFGAILNDWNPKRSSRYGNYRYYDRYKHYYGKEPQ